MNVHNEIEFLSLAGLSILIKCVWVRPGAYPRVEHLKGDSIGLTPALLSNIMLGLERLARDKHSCLLRTFENFGHKFFYNIGPRTNETRPSVACSATHFEKNKTRGPSHKTFLV